MFYSHTFLARKGPLGTVWCAAHLQHRLRKSHYISTNVISTVDRIMSPEVPIALRMSGHLLLGVVRIYSKQVDYLFDDCKEIRITTNRVFKTENINLPQDAAHAPLHSVTFPEKLDLDAVNIDEYYKNLGDDSHLKSVDEITLLDQISTGEDQYIIFSYDQDLRASEDNSETGATPMDEDVPPQAELNTPTRPKYPSSSNQAGPVNSNVQNITPQSLSSVEIQYGAVNIEEIVLPFNNMPILPDRAAPDRSMEEEINRDKEPLTETIEEIVQSPGGNFPSPHGHEENQPSPGHLNSQSHFDHPSPEMVIQQSPPNAEQPEVHCDDKGIVLRNRRMKRWLNNTSNITRERGNCPSSSLDVWRVNKRLRLSKEDVIFDPYINRASATLEAIHSEDIIKSTKFQLSPNQETNAAQPPKDSDIEIAVLQNKERDIPPSFIKNAPSSVGGSFLTPENSNSGLQSERMETTGNTDGLLPTTSAGPSGYHDSEMETPDTFFDRSLQGDLEFLDQYGNSAAGPDGTPEPSVFSKTHRGTPELQALSSRTRYAAQYLKRQSSVTPISENASETQSLNKILEGKLRKICARMFFETLVLRSHGLVDVHQESPYGDITLKLTSKLSKGQFKNVH